ncbi:MAG: outer membrane protein assembly factor BamD [Candidatus Pelagibacter sp.]|nr:outer membrane protein assembly factor BamD [Candidatus Pelagibacter sp.]RPG11497.1 MAG: outer membrane protein assembly factor BamD [Pelagibacteraceae bacterium TMED170]
MFHKLFYLLLLVMLNFGCSKEDPPINKPAKHEKSFEIYKEAVDSLESGDYFYASKKFAEAETILPQIEFAAKASLMSSYCLYIINFYDEAIENLERFIKVYPADKNIAYANYLLAISLYEQILDEKKDIVPLLKSKEKIELFLNEYPNSEYALDLKFKLDLINNQLAAKELYIAKYYIQSQKWIPAINRLKVIVEKYSETIFIEEALHRLVEVYFIVGLLEEAKTTAVILGYNYNTSKWYENSYKILNKEYKIKKIEKTKKDDGLIKRTIKKLLK